MEKNAPIYLAGHTGLVGSALHRKLEAEGYTNLLLRKHTDLDLTDQAKVEAFFRREQPEHVLIAAARVGGIYANSAFPAEFLYINLAIATNVIHAAWKLGVKRLLFLGSSCIYPKLAPQPMQEEHLLAGPLEPTNEPYAIAKIAGLKLCETYNRQYGTRFCGAMPTNLYGPGDNFHPERSHVLPSLLRRFHEAKDNGAPEVVVWGSGEPKREFLYVDDLADACLFLMNLPPPIFQKTFMDRESPVFVNIGTGFDLTIRELAEKIKSLTGYSGNINFDLTKPDGPPRKLVDTTRLTNLGWRPQVDLDTGLARTYRWFLEHQDSLRTL